MATFNTKKKRLTVGEHAVIDQEVIYARVIGLLVSQRDLNFQEALATELTAYHLKTSASSHEIWQKKYLMLPNRSWSWSNVVVFQSDLVKRPTVVAWGINFLALFCACGGGRACLNDEVVNQDVDTDDYDKDVEDDSNDEEDNLYK